MRPTEHGFVGPLAGELEEYIRFKASMGRHGATRVQVLRSFDRHCLEHGAVRLERGVVERWIAHRIDANPGGCRSWFSYIRDFGRWMRLAHDPDAYVLSDQWKAGSPRPTPYLLTDREAALFLRAAGTLDVFCQVGVGRFGVSFSPCERRVSGRFGVGRSCWLLVIALVIA